MGCMDYEIIGKKPHLTQIPLSLHPAYLFCSGNEHPHWTSCYLPSWIAACVALWFKDAEFSSSAQSLQLGAEEKEHWCVNWMQGTPHVVLVQSCSGS